MQHHEAVVFRIIVCDDLHDLHPGVGAHLRRVEHRVELIGRNRVTELLQFRHIVSKMLEIK